MKGRLSDSYWYWAWEFALLKADLPWADEVHAVHQRHQMLPYGGGLVDEDGSLIYRIILGQIAKPEYRLCVWCAADHWIKRVSWS